MSDFVIGEGKYPADEYAVEIDCAAWLGTETIASLACSAVRTDTGADATSAVLDPAKQSNTATKVLPWIKGGASGVQYKVSAVFTTNAGAKKTVTVSFAVK